MVVHRARLVYPESTGQGFHDWLSVWLTNMEPWAARENTVPDLIEPSPNSPAEPHYRGDLTFEWQEDKAIIVDNLDQYLASYASWHLLGYHDCDHDEQPDGCSWGQIREGGTPPSWATL